MNKGLFKAKPKMSLISDTEGNEEWLTNKLDKDGYVTGYLVEDYIVGGFIDVDVEYTILEYWIPIEEKTIEYLGGSDNADDKSS